MKQDTLPGVPRARVPIRDDAVAEATQGELVLDVEAFLRPEKGTSEGPRRTAWSSERPAPGLWEVTDRRTGAMRGLWWFGGVWWVMSDRPGASPGQTGMHYDDFARGYAWRGLAQRPEEKYSCPPYDLRTVPAGCELDVSVPLAPRRPVTR